MNNLLISLFFVIVSISIPLNAQADAGMWAGALSGAAKGVSDALRQQAEIDSAKERIRLEYEMKAEMERQSEARRVAAENQRRKAEKQRQDAENKRAEQDRQEKEAKAIYTGSGFFVTQDGYFVTNHHVVKNAKSILLLTTDGRRLEAKLVRSDVANDLVLLKVEGKYSALPVASSRIVKRGQSVATIGYPHADIQGVEPKVTEGIVSSLSGISNDPRMFQISVPIQSGNSGGPLVTKEGNVIGIVVSKLSVAAMLKETGDVTQNVNYAVKSNYLIELLYDSGLERKLLPAKKSSKSLEDITAIVEKATALVIASATQILNITTTTSTEATQGCPACLKMVAIPGKNYEIGKYEVTQAEWEAVMGSNPSYFKGANLPVEQVSWDDVQEYLTKLNQKTGKQYRLPTEAEWEYVCYGGSQTEYCGSNDINAVAWHKENSGNQTHLAGQKQANGYGLYDISCNVWEWMEECWEGNCALRVLRGGSWFNRPQNARAANRDRYVTTVRDSTIGFRLARTLP